MRNGTLERLKARLVAGGYMMDRTIYPDTRSPTVSTDSLLLVVAVAAAENRRLKAVDIGNAYLEAAMTGEEVLMTLDAWCTEILVKLDPTALPFVNSRGELVVRLDKALYGCLTSAKEWFEHLRGILLSIGYVQNAYDECVFNRVVDGVQLTACVYVDDILLTSVSEEVLERALTELKKFFLEVKSSEGTDLDYVSLEIDYGGKQSVTVSMSKYITECLAEWGGNGISSTPNRHDLFDNDDTNVLSDTDREVFHHRVAKLLYLAKRVRPDILLPISFLAGRVTCCTERDGKALDQVYRYLNGARDLCLVYPKSVPAQFEAFVDASFGIHCDGTSRTGIVMAVSGVMVSCFSLRQRIVTKSSTEAELVALSDGAGYVLWMREWALAQGYPLETVVIWQDNQAVLSLIGRGGRASGRTRHLNIRYFFVADRVKSRELELKYLPTKEMLADLLTKGLVGALFRALRDSLMGLTQ